MSISDRYFDHAATTPIDPRVLAEMMPYLTAEFGNAHSIHGFGQRAAAAVDLARQRVATLIDADYPEQVVFTSGATEACNWVIRDFKVGYIGPFEHSAVREPALKAGYQVIPNEADWVHYPEQPFVPVPCSVACNMTVNNETGMCWAANENGALWGDSIFSDMTQALGKIPIAQDSVDFAAFSAHKLYGPKGIGALYVGSILDDSLLLGGDQEFGLRAGTLNVPGIVGFGAACAIAEQEMAENYRSAAENRAVLLEELRACSDWQINESSRQIPHILSLSFLGVEGETIVIEADQAGFAISSGAACSSRSTEPSHVLTALGVPTEWLRGTVRISFGRSNTPDSARMLGRKLTTIVENLRKF